MSKMKSGIRSSYNQWASQYDTNLNKTRDLEAVSLRTELVGMQFRKGLEMGCGTGKNTSRLLEICESVTAMDFSEEMLSIAKQRFPEGRVCFLQADIQEPWPVEEADFDLITFSLVLEHIENLDDIFLKASQVLIPGGMFYLGELHPFRQYRGSKARFDTEEGLHVLTCFTHHISDFIQSARLHAFGQIEIQEYFDDGNRASLPRILSVTGRKMRKDDGPVLPGLH